MRNSNIFIIIISLMDFITALLILLDPNRLVVARLGIFYELFKNPSIGAILLLLAVACALIGLMITSSVARFILFIPQQLFLIMTTGSAIDYIFMQHYADGVLRPWQFILQDQLPTIILTIGYFYAVREYMKK